MIRGRIYQVLRFWEEGFSIIICPILAPHRRMNVSLESSDIQSGEPVHKEADQTEERSQDEELESRESCSLVVILIRELIHCMPQSL